MPIRRRPHRSPTAPAPREPLVADGHLTRRAWRILALAPPLLLAALLVGGGVGWAGGTWLKARAPQPVNAAVEQREETPKDQRQRKQRLKADAAPAVAQDSPAQPASRPVSRRAAPEAAEDATEEPTEAATAAPAEEPTEEPAEETPTEAADAPEADASPAPEEPTDTGDSGDDAAATSDGDTTGSETQAAGEPTDAETDVASDG